MSEVAFNPELRSCVQYRNFSRFFNVDFILLFNYFSRRVTDFLVIIWYYQLWKCPGETSGENYPIERVDFKKRKSSSRQLEAKETCDFSLGISRLEDVFI